MTTVDKVIDIGTRLEPFIDEYLIDRMNGARLVLHPPTQREVAIDHDGSKPWEGNTCWSHSVFQDGDIYRMYYRGSSSHDPKLNPKGGGGAPVVCYAESEDGIHWIRPELGVVEIDGSDKNNIVWPPTDHRVEDGTAIGSSNFDPFKDTNPNCKLDERYKAIGQTPGPSLTAFKSPDGIGWSILKEAVITDGEFDSLNVAT